MSHFTHIKTGTCDSEYISPVGVVPGGNAPAMVMYLMQKVEELESKQAIIGNQTGDKSFTFVQSQNSDTWVIIHNLNKYPSVQIQDSAGTDVVGEIYYDSLNQITLRFSAPFSGKAYLN